jgi:adenylylsulfate kinase
MIENRKRSIIKTVSWRIFATFTTMIIVFSFTRKISLSLGVGFFEITSKLALYYVHERLWNKISWGKTAVD